MRKKEIKKKNPLIKINKNKKAVKKDETIKIYTKHEIKNTNNKNVRKKARARSIPSIPKVELNEQKNSNNNKNQMNNSLELDYLNFSKIDLFKLDQSFEDDIFNPHYNRNNRNKNVLNRYEDSNSNLNENI